MDKGVQKKKKKSSWVRKMPYYRGEKRRKLHPIPVFLPRESRGQRSLLGCCPWGRTELDMTEATQHTCMHWRGKQQPTPVFLPGDSQGQRSLVGCCLWGCTETQQPQPHRGGKVKVKMVVTQLCLTICDPTDVTHQAPLSMEFPRQGYWSGQSLKLQSNFLQRKLSARNNQSVTRIPVQQEIGMKLKTEKSVKDVDTVR